MTLRNKLNNDYLGEKCLKIKGSGMMIHLFLPEKYMKLWSDKIGKRRELWMTEEETKTKYGGIRLDKLESN